MRHYRIPLVNRGPEELQIALEPEGDWLGLQAGESLEIRYSTDDDRDAPVVELEIEGKLLSVHVMFRKEVWKGGRRVR